MIATTTIIGQRTLRGRAATLGIWNNMYNELDTIKPLATRTAIWSQGVGIFGCMLQLKPITAKAIAGQNSN
ncbi:MAG: hypothetical protein ACK5E3_07130 [Planctomycetota bacterium]